MTLGDLKPGESGIVVKVKGRGAFHKRLTEMGFVRGVKVDAIRIAPLGDPLEYRLMGYGISLRRNEAKLIEIVSERVDCEDQNQCPYYGIIDEESLKISAQEKGKIIDVGFVGNPNSGKTSLFNAASGATEKVGNYSGVTVDAKRRSFKKFGYKFNIIDLPGTYSLLAYSHEELFIRNYIFERKPDIIVNVIDASNLERNLYLTTQLIDMDVKVVIALNMYDEMSERGDSFDYQWLSQLMGIPIIPTVAKRKIGVDDLFHKVIDIYEERDPLVRHIHINYGEDVERSIAVLKEKISKSSSFVETVAARYYAIKLLEKDAEIINEIEKWNDHADLHEICSKEVAKLESIYNASSETIIADARYGFITGALKETYQRKEEPDKKTITQKIDAVLTHKIWGYPIFLAFLFLMLFCTFGIGKYPMNWLEAGVGWLGNSVKSSIESTFWRDLIADGIVGGVGGVIVFLPSILILFLFISIMEDTGYMARVAFIMDKLMHRIGLHGKSFIPMIMGFGCNVPAIMATRTLENRGDRLLTMLTIPFMSCSARMIVYTLFIGVFFPNHNYLVMFLLYLLGMILAIIFAWMFKRVIFKTQEMPFVMELPPYRVPTSKAVFLNMWLKARHYLRKMGGVILVASIMVWLLGYFPKNSEREMFYDTQRNIVMTEYNGEEQMKKIDSLNTLESSEGLEDSYIGRIGKFIEPAIRPLGFEWKTGVALLAGISAKEILISTLGVMYQIEIEDAKEENPELKEIIANDTYKNGPRIGQKVFTPLTTVSLLVFVLVYFPCVAVFAAVGKESGSWKWATFLMFYTTALAWILSFAVYQIGNLFY
jgi:ferrous iron transport protein B